MVMFHYLHSYRYLGIKISSSQVQTMEWELMVLAVETIVAKVW